MSLRSTGSVLVVFLWSSTVVLGQDDWGVTYYTQSICVLKGSTVELSCTYKYPSGYKVTSTFWFTRNDVYGNYVNLSYDPDYTGRVKYHENKNNHTLIITDLRESDSAEYKFRFITDHSGGRYSGNPGVTLSFPGLKVVVTGGDIKTLTCKTKCPLTGNPTYIWYKNGQQIYESSSPQYKDPVYSNYRDSYSCSVKGHEDLHSPTVCVQDQYCSRVTYNQRRICVLKGSSVDISCTYVGYYSVTSSLWFRPKQSGTWRDKINPVDLTKDPGYAGRVEYPDQESRTYRDPFILRITDLREEDSAEYRFTFKTSFFEWGHSFPGTTLTVTDLQVKMTPDRVTEGQNVTLTCITSCPLTGNTTYIWYKKNVTSPKASGRRYSITDITSEDSGEYYCEVWNGRGSMNSSTLMVTVAGKQTSVLTASAGITVVVLVLILCLSGFIWFKMRGCKSPSDTTDKTDDGQTESTPVYDNISDMVMTSTAAQTADTDNQDVLHYASVHYSSSKEQEVPLYPPIEKQEEEVQYVAVKINCPSAATQPTTQTAEVDPSRIYSSVYKPRINKK
ncbi:sialoadhesin-like isoform X2 [Esox lucius]|uniref:B-cell receptor CD22 n=1 Tax=Esox lucius TaxID=8010 RepID=A0A6Q2Z218_ESOLU|nr:sialoadhesin-like isoform X2 [Esox lucius]XP_034150203.1 sialoadhesin-like isoform X2 [Esox lucius]XP_034150204.1 sialoadhesin-like isoform X2 [Esox lucius]